MTFTQKISLRVLIVTQLVINRIQQSMRQQSVGYQRKRKFLECHLFSESEPKLSLNRSIYHNSATFNEEI